MASEQGVILALLFLLMYLPALQLAARQKAVADTVQPATDTVQSGTDLEKAKEILTNIVTTHEKILKLPPPAVLVGAFSSSAIDFQLFFWMSHPRDTGVVKSDVISAIHIAFKEHGIEIPFPQQDLYIHTDTGNEEKKG